jgi:hypothetical protein
VNLGSIAGHSLNFPITVTFTNLIEDYLATVFGVLGLVVLIKIATSFFGEGIGDKIPLLVIQFTAMFGLYAIFSVIAESGLETIPFGFGTLINVILGVYFSIGVIMHLIA